MVVTDGQDGNPANPPDTDPPRHHGTGLDPASDGLETATPDAEHGHAVASAVRLAVVIAALGVVFGDIGTSPIYTIQTVFSPDDPHPVPVSTANVFGVVSLIFWSAMIIVTVTYILLAL